MPEEPNGLGAPELDPELAELLVADANLLADIVGHPESPCLEELSYMNPALGEDEILDVLSELVASGLVMERTLEQGDDLAGQPCTFYGLTSKARAKFDELGLFPEGAWTRQYAAVKKSDRIKELERIPRP